MLMKFLVFNFVVFGFVGECLASTYGVKLNDLEKLTALTNYYVAKEPKVKKPTFPNKPNKPLIPQSKKLLKGKYEKLESFEKRVESEKLHRLKKLKELEKIYTYIFAYLKFEGYFTPF